MKRLTIIYGAPQEILLMPLLLLWTVAKLAKSVF